MISWTLNPYIILIFVYIRLRAFLFVFYICLNLLWFAELDAKTLFLRNESVNAIKKILLYLVFAIHIIDTVKLKYSKEGIYDEGVTARKFRRAFSAN